MKFIDLSSVSKTVDDRIIKLSGRMISIFDFYDTSPWIMTSIGCRRVTIYEK
jgi:hypothetical protein